MSLDFLSSCSAAHRPKALAAALIALGMTAVGPSAQAAPVTTSPQVGSFSISITRDFPFSTPTTGSLAVFSNEFDGTLGTLQQVVFRWDTALVASLINSGFDTGFGDPVPKIDASVDAEIVGLGQLFSSTFTASVADGAEGATISQSVMGTRTYSAPADLAYFIGSGTFTTKVTLGVTVATDNASASMASSWETPLRTGLFSVEYVYEPAGVRVPEPGVLLLGAAAVLAFGVSGWRQRGAKH